MINMRTYSNPWIPDGAYKILCNEAGIILDVGGGSSPYVGASHVLDMNEFSLKCLTNNAWGVPSNLTDNSRIMDGVIREWSERQYTQFDVCSGKAWPFKDKQFDLGLCSHTLEDLRDPLLAARELFRVSKRVLIIGPSRLLEQTKGVDNPWYCGFPHHLWMIYEENGAVIIRRKAAIPYLRGCHLVCPLGKTLSREAGSMFITGSDMKVVEKIFYSSGEERKECIKFLEPYINRMDIFVDENYKHDLRYWIWKCRQRIFGTL